MKNKIDKFFIDSKKIYILDSIYFYNKYIIFWIKKSLSYSHLPNFNPNTTRKGSDRLRPNLKQITFL